MDKSLIIYDELENLAIKQKYSEIILTYIKLKRKGFDLLEIEKALLNIGYSKELIDQSLTPIVNYLSQKVSFKSYYFLKALIGGIILPIIFALFIVPFILRIEHFFIQNFFIILSGGICGNIGIFSFSRIRFGKQYKFMAAISGALTIILAVYFYYDFHAILANEKYYIIFAKKIALASFGGWSISNFSNDTDFFDELEKLILEQTTPATL